MLALSKKEIRASIVENYDNKESLHTSARGPEEGRRLHRSLSGLSYLVAVESCDHVCSDLGSSPQHFRLASRRLRDT